MERSLVISDMAALTTFEPQPPKHVSCPLKPLPVQVSCFLQFSAVVLFDLFDHKLFPIKMLEQRQRIHNQIRDTTTRVTLAACKPTTIPL